MGGRGKRGVRPQPPLAGLPATVRRYLGSRRGPVQRPARSGVPAQVRANRFEPRRHEQTRRLERFGDQAPGKCTK